MRCFLLASTLVALLFVSACETKTQVDRPHLPTWDPSDAGIFNDAALGPGTLDMSTGCVLLILENQKSVLPVWPFPTSWNSSSQAIEFVGVWGERMELREGDTIILGSVTPRVEPEFLSPPGPSCKAEKLFRLHSLSEVTY